MMRVRWTDAHGGAHTELLRPPTHAQILRKTHMHRIVSNLMSLARRGLVDECRSILRALPRDEATAIVRTPSPRNNATVLHAAAASANAGCISLFCEYGACVDAVDGSQRTPLMVVARTSGSTPATRELLRNGATPNYAPVGGASIVELVVETGNVETLRLLLDAAPQTDLYPVLEEAVDRNRGDVIAFLVKRGARLDATDFCGCTPLVRAVARGRMNAIRALLEAGDDPVAPTPMGSSALGVAVRLAAVDTVCALLDAGADPNARDGGACLLDIAGTGCGRADRFAPPPSPEAVEATRIALLAYGASAEGARVDQRIMCMAADEARRRAVASVERARTPCTDRVAAERAEADAGVAFINEDHTHAAIWRRAILAGRWGGARAALNAARDRETLRNAKLAAEADRAHGIERQLRTLMPAA